MSDTRRIIPITVDVEASARRVVVGTALQPPDGTQTMNLFYGTKLLFKATCYSGAVTTAYGPEATANYIFGIDSVFTSSHDDLVYSANNQFNIIGDWSGQVVTNGQICWRADLATDNLKTVLNALAASTQSMTMYAYLWMMPTTGGHVLLATWPVEMYRIAVDPVTAVAIDGIAGVTTEQAASMYVPLNGDQSAWRFSIAKGWQYYFTAESKWRSLLPQLLDGVPVLAFGDPED